VVAGAVSGAVVAVVGVVVAVVAWGHKATRLAPPPFAGG
jgi:hypothetical protein